MEGNEGMDERFEDYESYVDAAVAAVRGTYTAELEALQVRERDGDAALATSMDKLQGKLLDGVDMFLNTTVTITNKISGEFRTLVKSRSDAVVSAVLKARREALEGQEAVQQKLLDTVMERFDRELEEHQGKMSQRFANLTTTLGGKVGAMRVAKAAELRDELRLQRELMKDHDRRVEEAAKERLDAETARLETYWKDMANGYEALKRKFELREFQLEKAQEELAKTQARLEQYEPPPGSEAYKNAGGKAGVTADNQQAWLDDAVSE